MYFLSLCMNTCPTTRQISAERAGISMQHRTFVTSGDCTSCTSCVVTAGKT